LRADGIDNPDIGFMKNTAITDRFRLKLRTDIFNLTNTRGAGIPDGASIGGVPASVEHVWRAPQDSARGEDCLLTWLYRCERWAPLNGVPAPFLRFGATRKARFERRRLPPIRTSEIYKIHKGMKSNEAISY
jgi:hypothetical protein